MTTPNHSEDQVTNTDSAMRKVNIGTRRSALALVQAEAVLAALRKSHPNVEFDLIAMATAGDKNQDTSLSKFGSKALWTQELETSLLEGSLDLLVHCLKDLPTQLPPNCEIGCIMEREDPRDVVIMKKGTPFKKLSDLPAGAVFGTSSVRRNAQIKRLYPQLACKDIRGNIGTRLNKLDATDSEYSCLILAAAGILRMGWAERITQYLDSTTENAHFYAVGQGALAIEVREGDQKIIDMLSNLADSKSTLAGTSERSLMRTLEGGCSVPIGVESTWIDKGKLMMKAIVVSLDGKRSVRAERLDEILDVNDANEFGLRLAQDLIEKGALLILDQIKQNRSAVA
ncbi:BgTH12-07050 [Blumeria graminis f. sp. triticale]|uniref:Porphobilinogen deaminase n=1 Tax=Blumeria graminis f. sp. triticale TaxID=1689686 RepID=A0A9W4GJP5_BLUGR|nr:BgTH12-07050 [Blumeria graminis f. sp. triticale]